MLAPVTYTVTGAFAYSGVVSARHLWTISSHYLASVRELCETVYKISPRRANEPTDDCYTRAWVMCPFSADRGGDGALLQMIRSFYGSRVTGDTGWSWPLPAQCPVISHSS